MISISSSPLSLISSNVSFDFNTSSSLLYTFSQKQHQLSKNRKPKHHQIACTSNDTNQNSPKEQEQKQSPRRNVLIGLGGLYGASTLTDNNSLAFAAPVPIPDITKCVIPPIELPTAPGKHDLSHLSCCPPYSSEMIDFEFPTFKKLRVRQAAHLYDDNYEKYNRALALMKALPDDDPRSFTQQANIHCAYCNGGYTQLGYPGVDLQVHKSWLFLPFHRLYLYFYERILGSLIDDPTFALPFWNWDAPDGMQIPSIFTNPNSSLYDSKRNPDHQPPNIIDLAYSRKSPDPNPTIEKNLALMHTQMICNSSTWQLFHGSPYRAGDDGRKENVELVAGSAETSPHNSVHVWCGDFVREDYGEDMGNFYSSGRDPLFYALHGNVDRMWSIWKTLGGKNRKDPTDNDWLESAFVFYDENKNLVKVKVKDSVDEKKLGYSYQKLDLPWKKRKPSRGKSKGKGSKQRPSKRFVEKFPIVLDSVVSTVVKRPRKSRNLREKEDEEEILVIDGIKFDSSIEVKFDVLVNDEDDKVIGVENSEFAGTFVTVLHGPEGNNKKTNTVTGLRLGLSELLENLDADDDDSIVVTLVPRYGDGVQIRRIYIKYES